MLLWDGMSLHQAYQCATQKQKLELKETPRKGIIHNLTFNIS